MSFLTNVLENFDIGDLIDIGSLAYDLFSEDKTGELGAQGATAAAAAELQGTREALQFASGVYNQQRSDLEPQRYANYVGLQEMAHQLGLPPSTTPYQSAGASSATSGGGTSGGGTSVPVGGPAQTQGTSAVRNGLAAGLASAAAAKYADPAARALGGALGGTVTNPILTGSGIFSGAGSAAGNIAKFGGAAVGGILTGLTTDGSKAKKIGAGAGAAAGAQIGTAVLPGIGTVIGGALGGIVGGVTGKIHHHSKRNQLGYDPQTGQFVSEGGILRNEGDIRQSLQSGQLTPNPDYPGMFDLPVGSLDGHALLIDAEGNIRSGTNGRGLTEPFFNVFTGEGDLSYNGQNVTNTGGGHPGYGTYTPQVAPQVAPPQVTQVAPPQVATDVPNRTIQPVGGTEVIPEVIPEGIPEGIPDAAPQGFTYTPSGGRYGAFEKSPGYDFVRDETLRAAERSAAARGGLISGRTLRELERYGSGLASTEYDNYFRRLAQYTGIGSTGVGQTVNAGSDLSGIGANSIFRGGLASGGGIRESTESRISGIAGTRARREQGIEGLRGVFV